MPRFLATDDERTRLLTGVIDIPEQYYTKYANLSLKELEDDEEALEEIKHEAYYRLAKVWMNHCKDNEIGIFLEKLHEKAEIDKHNIEFRRNVNKWDKDVAKDILQHYMIEIFNKAKVIEEPYYRANMRDFEGIASPFLFSPEVYDKKPHEVDYDEERKKNPDFWQTEILEFFMDKINSVVDQAKKMFLNSALLEKIRKKFEAGSRTVAMNVLNVIEEKAEKERKR